MKLLAAVIVLLQLTTDAAAKQSLSQTPINRAYLTNKEWIGPNGEYLHITNDSAILQTDHDHEKTAFSLDENLMMLHVWQSGSDGKDYSYNDSFIIDRLNTDTLILRSFKKRAQTGMRVAQLRNGEPIVFVNHNILIDPHFTFQKIFYSFRGGMSSCRGEQIAIDSSGTVLVASGPGSCGKFNGTYKGQLSTVQLKQLSELVNKSVPERFALSSGWEDGGSTLFRFCYNNKVKEISGQKFPYLAIDLMGFLNSVFAKVAMEKISDDVSLYQK